ncbi:hypothetical protein [Cellulomonas sp. ES6]|uniref:hypothetical protein n=1 Tax=Cellulomonas sp. ES6 TaxID=3039384 RepID=UPI0024B69DEF|nr:hypothetical protein [Cellulomonas sp. ES6]WHP19072.1 hypothetical protein P9841_08180 [Cellulomonas sp. ES6]
MTRRRAAAVVAATAGLLVLLLLTPASAARLLLSSGGLTTAAAAPCTTAALAAGTGGASGTLTTVVLSGVPAACRGQQATLRLHTADGTPLAASDASVTLAAADTTTVTVPAYAASRVAGVALTVGTWGVPVTWAAPQAGPSGPVTPGPGTVFGPLRWTVLPQSGTQACVVVPVSGDAGTTWRIDLHLDQRPFNGVADGSGFEVHTPYWAKVLDPRPVDGVVQVGGVASGGMPGAAVLQAGQSFEVEICHYRLPAPAYDPALTYSQTSTAVTGSAYDACFTTTVRVTGTPQFFAGWRADVDLEPLQTFFAASGRSLDTSRIRTSTGELSVAPLGGTVYRVTPRQGWSALGIRDDVPQTFGICAGSR